MVLLSLKQAPDGWQVLRGAGTSALDARLSLAPSSAARGQGPVLVFVAASDVDALAASRILTALLRADLARYEIHPVIGYDDLAAKFAVLATKVEPRAVLLVNCGAMVDLGAVLRLEEDELQPTDVRVFVMDCHRPYHLRNIRNERVVLFDDLEDNAMADMPLDVDWEDRWGNVELEDSSDEESESDDSDDSSDDNSLGGGNEFAIAKHTLDSADTEAPTVKKTKPKKRKRRRDRDADAIMEDDVLFDGEGTGRADADDDSDDEDDNQDEGPSQPTKRRGRKAKRKRIRRSRGRSSHDDDPEIMEREKLRDYYSNATLAMSSACLSHSIAAVFNRSDMDSLWMAIVGVTSQFNSSSISSDLYEDARGYFLQQLKDPNLNGQKQQKDSSREQNVGYALGCNAVQTQRIAPNTELRLDLLRHWSLHGSLLHSTYTATRLSAWRQTGKRRLLEMLATLGIPLKDSQQDWCYMKQKNKLALERHLPKAIQRFDLGVNIEYESFVRSLPGHRGDVSAADFSHAISALLEFDDRSQRTPRGEISPAAHTFWAAYDALDMKKSDLLDTGLDMAVSIQKLTAEVGGDVIESRKFVPSGPFRYMFLRDQQSKELFAHPLLLRRLALFLKKALTRQGAREKPFIILAPEPSRDIWIAVAATTSGQRNDFGHRFRKAAERNGSQVTYDAFDSAVCEIKDGQEIEFVRFLHDVMR